MSEFDINEEELKQLIGDPFYVRPYHKEREMIKPKFPFVLHSSNSPKIPGHDEATWRRIKTIHFSRSSNE